VSAFGANAPALTPPFVAVLDPTIGLFAVAHSRQSLRGLTFRLGTEPDGL